jgi:hypothetical protein
MAVARKSLAFLNFQGFAQPHPLFARSWRSGYR